MPSHKKLAVVLFNLGSPDSPEAIKPFLFNLFSDPAILKVPNPLRWILASLLSWSRTSKTKELYARIGGQSKLLEHTKAQALELHHNISDMAEQVEVFIFMRYWHPFVDETVQQIKEFSPERIVLLPLYPQFSTTTVGTSLKAFHEEAARQHLNVPVDTLCCYPAHDAFIKATVEHVTKSMEEASAYGTPRLLLSAHGLPERTIADGDPYQWQVELTASALVDALALPNLDWVVCYQSRVGPVKWIGPFTEDEVEKAGKDGVPVVICPIAFVSEHLETQVEVDMELRAIAEKSGVPGFVRAPALVTNCTFIAGLGDLVRQTLFSGAPRSYTGKRICPNSATACPEQFGRNDLGND